MILYATVLLSQPIAKLHECRFHLVPFQRSISAPSAEIEGSVVKKQCQRSVSCLFQEQKVESKNNVHLASHQISLLETIIRSHFLVTSFMLDFAVNRCRLSGDKSVPCWTADGGYKGAEI